MSRSERSDVVSRGGCRPPRTACLGVAKAAKQHQLAGLPVSPGSGKPHPAIALAGNPGAGGRVVKFQTAELAARLASAAHESDQSRSGDSGSPGSNRRLCFHCLQSPASFFGVSFSESHCL